MPGQSPPKKRRQDVNGDLGDVDDMDGVAVRGANGRQFDGDDDGAAGQPGESPEVHHLNAGLEEISDVQPTSQQPAKKKKKKKKKKPQAALANPDDMMGDPSNPVNEEALTEEEQVRRQELQAQEAKLREIEEKQRQLIEQEEKLI